MAMTRRQFLSGSAASALTLGLNPWLRWLPGTSVSYAAGPSDAIVVFVQLLGGNDGLNTVYPLDGMQRAKYEEYRPTLKLPNTGAGVQPWTSAGFGSQTVLDVGLNLNGTRYAFHPAMGALHRLYQDGKLAILNGVHYPFASHSHFRSEAVWHSADPLGVSGQGWLGTYLNTVGYQPAEVPCVQLGAGIKPLFTPTTTSVFSFSSLLALRFPTHHDPLEKQAAFRQLYDETIAASMGVSPELVKIGQMGRGGIDHFADFYRDGSGLANAGKVEALLLDSNGDYGERNRLVYSSPLNASSLDNKWFARDLRHVAATIRANIGVRFFHIGMRGFDTHSNQEKNFYHSALLAELSEAVAGFYSDMAQSVSLPAGYIGYETGSLAHKVVIVVFSEFGRTMRQNATNPDTAGTDHATSAPMLVLGGTVRGGQYGAYPRLDMPGKHANDLRMTYDFRDVFGTLLTRWLNVPVADVGPGVGKILPATPEVDPLGNSYTAFTPLGFLAA